MMSWEVKAITITFVKHGLDERLIKRITAYEAWSEIGFLPFAKIYIIDVMSC